MLWLVLGNPAKYTCFNEAGAMEPRKCKNGLPVAASSDQLQ